MNVITPHLRIDVPYQPVSAAPTPTGPIDTVDLQPVDALRAMQRIERVDKDAGRFTLHATLLAPDGSFYLGYGQYGAGPGYLSRVQPDGTVDWDAPVTGLRGIALDDRGVVHAVSDTEEVRFGSDGAELGRAALADKPERFWVDPATGRTLLMVGRQLKAADGGPLPQGLPDKPVQDFMPADDGRTLCIRTSDRWARLTSEVVQDQRPVPPPEGSGKVWINVDHVHPLPDGATLLQMRRTIEIAAPHGFRGGGHMMFMRYPGPMEPFNGEYVTETYFRKLDAAGAEVWKSDNLGESVRFTVSDGGEIYVATLPRYKEQAKVQRISDDGKLVPMAELSGVITGLQVDEKGLVVRHDRSIARVGATVGDVASPEGWTAQRFLPDGRVLLHDNQSTAAALLDPRDGSVTSLTDRETDHSMGRQGELRRVARELPPSGPGPGIQVEDEWVIVGEVRVPRNSD